MTKVGSTKVVNFMTPRSRSSCARVMPYTLYSEKTSFLKKSSSPPQAYIRQTKNINIMIVKDGSTKVVNFMTPGTGGLVLGRGHISHIVKMHHFFETLLH